MAHPTDADDVPPTTEDLGDRRVRKSSVEATALRRGLWTSFGVLLAVVIALTVREVRSVIILVLVAIFLAVGLDPLVRQLVRRGVRRHWAVVIVGISVVLVLALIITVLISVLRDQLTSLINDAPELLRRLRRHKTVRNLDRRYHVLSSLEKKLSEPDLGASLLSNIFGLGLGALRVLASTVVVFVLTLYFLGALPQLKRALSSLAPDSRRKRVLELTDNITLRTGKYVIGAFAVAFIAGLVTAIFLISVGLGGFALPLALLVGLLDLVPLVGSIVGASSVVIVCLANSVPLGITAGIFYLVYETLEGYVIYPRVMRSSVDVPEYVTIIAVLAGGTLSGIVGALLSLPVTAALIYLIRELWVRRQDEL